MSSSGSGSIFKKEVTLSAEDIQELSKQGFIIDGNSILIGYSNQNATSVTIPEGVKGISDEVFCKFEKLGNVTIPSSATSIGDYAFPSNTNVIYQ